MAAAAGAALITLSESTPVGWALTISMAPFGLAVLVAVLEADLVHAVFTVLKGPYCWGAAALEADFEHAVYTVLKGPYFGDAATSLVTESGRAVFTLLSGSDFWGIYHRAENDYSFDALQFDCFRNNIKL